MRLEHPSGRTNRAPRPEEISLRPGARLAFFTVSASKEDTYLVLTAEDPHLIAHLMVEVAPTGTEPKNNFQITTVVRYRRWTRSLYFNLVRPLALVEHELHRAGLHKFSLIFVAVGDRLMRLAGGQLPSLRKEGLVARQRTPLIPFRHRSRLSCGRGGSSS